MSDQQKQKNAEDGEGEEMVLQEDDQTELAAADVNKSNSSNNDGAMKVEASLSLEETMAVALQKKTEGNAHFANQAYAKAADAYREALQALDNNPNTATTTETTPATTTTTTTTAKDLQVSLRSNLVQCCLKLNLFDQAEHQASIVLDKWDASVPKVWYRRAMARESLASAALVEIQVEPQSASGSSVDVGDNTTATTSQQYMDLALADLSQCVRLIKSQANHDDQMLKTALTALTRIMKRLNVWKKEGISSSNRSMNGTTTNVAPAVLASTMNGHATAAPTGAVVAKEESLPLPPRPSPEQQRQDVMKLLIARSVGLQQQQAASSAATTGQGEALFLLNWNWWCQWCRHVDFFHTSAGTTTTTTGAVNPPKNVKAERVLKCLPAGAIRPYRNKNDDANDNDDSSTDSSDDGLPHIPLPPGPMDNTALFLLSRRQNGIVAAESSDAASASVTKSRFYQEWHQHFHSTPNNDVDDNHKDDNNATAAKKVKDRQKQQERLCLRPNLVRGFHYELIPREVYCALQSWYRELTPSICRRTVLTKTAIVNHPDNGSYSNGGGGGSSSNNQNEQRDALSIQLYPVFPPSADVATSNTSASSAPKCGACRGRSASRRCTRCLAVSYCDRACQESHWSYHKALCSKISANNKANPNEDAAASIPNKYAADIFASDGFCGLNNLGNTCFMNSALQCLSHATPLTRHFLSNQFILDVNASNPLGTGGKLAHAFDAVLKELWMKPNIRNTSPTALKRAIALFAPRFAGCLQHDAQEFLAYLLDGLHEDLNRIRRAPYVEMPDADDHGSNMGVAGAEAWECHTKRNDSLVMDSFYGQFQSTCVCPNSNCGRVSVSFDTFNHISLEIPQLQKSEMWYSILLFTNPRKNEDCVVRHAVCVSRGSLVADMRRALSEVSGVPYSHLVMCEVNNNRITEVLAESKSIASLRQEDFLTAYQVAPYTKSSIHAICRHSLLETPLEGEGSEEQTTDIAVQELFGYPFVASCDANLTCRQLWDHVWQRVRPMVVPLDDDGKEEEMGPQMEEVYQLLITLRLTGEDGSSVRVFPADDGQIEETEDAESTEPLLSPYVPRKLEERLSTFLGEDCTDRLLFLSLDWVATMPVPAEILQAAESANNQTSSGGHGSTNKKKKKNKKHITNKANNSNKEIPEAIGIQSKRFLQYTEHSSFTEGVKKQREMEANRGVSLDQCFETFTKPERLDENNKWYCSACKEHVRALKTMKLWRLPNILIVHLKRFAFRNAYRRDKLTTLVDFPLEGLNMNQHCAHDSGSDSGEGGDGPPPATLHVKDGVPAVYDLFAVTNHFGRMGFGHYTAFARKWDEKELSNDWSLFDDSHARGVGDGRAGNDAVVSPAAYVLFYRRRTFN